MGRAVRDAPKPSPEPRKRLGGGSFTTRSSWTDDDDIGSEVLARLAASTSLAPPPWPLS
jgi:hypothetical protein